MQILQLTGSWLPKTALLALLLLCLCKPAEAQELPYKDTLFLNTITNEHLGEYFSYYLSLADTIREADRADSLFGEGKFKRWHKPDRPFNPGISGKDVWFRVVVKSRLPFTTTFLWTLYNHVDSAFLYRKVDRTILLLNKVDGKSVAIHRPFNSRNFAIPFQLQPDESAVLYLRVVIKAESIYLLTDITAEQDYLTYEQRFWIDFNWYWLIGFFLFAGVFNLILFAFFRDALHLWYTAYVLSSGFFLLMEDNIDGLIFPEILYQAIWQIGQLNFMLLSGAASIGILQSFLKQHKASYFDKIGRWLVRIDIIFVIFFFLGRTYLTPLIESEGVQITRTLLLTTSFLYQAFAVIQGMLQKNRLAFYYAFAFSFFLLGALLFFLNGIGISVWHYLKPNTLAIGLFWELLLLLFFITIRFQLITRENLQLHMQELEQQKKISAQIILAQDEERQRLAKDLHDDLGNTITRLLLVVVRLKKVSNGSEDTVKEMESLLNKAHADVRSISHALLPLDLQEDGLDTSLGKMCAFLTANSKTAFQFFFTGDENEISKELGLVVYRICMELSSNILKHANATQAVMQCSIFSDHVLLTAEDNGGGFQPGQKPAGIGLKNIRNRVDLLKGKLNIDSNQAGTTIIIEIPLLNGYKAN